MGKLVQNPARPPHGLLLALAAIALSASSAIVARAAEVDQAQQAVDVLFADDLYLQTLPIGQIKPWTFSPKALDDASVAGQATIDPAAALSGTPALRVRPAAGQQRASVQWTHDVEPGRFYSLSAAYRSAPRRDDDPPDVMPMYGFVSIEWLDARGARIAVRDKLVSRPSTDAFWTLLQTKGLAPPGATQARINLVAGWHEPREDFSAWFANVRWEAVAETPLVLELFPRLLQQADDPLRITVRRLHPESFTTDARLTVELVDQSGKVHRRWTTPNMMTVPWVTEVQLPQGAPADAQWTVRATAEPIRANEGSIVWTASEPVLLANSRLENRIRDRRYVMDGRKQFIIGAYHAEPEDFAALKAAGFNTMLTREYDPQSAVKLFDRLRSLGLYGTASLGGGGQTRGNQPRVSGVIEALRDHPALLAFDLMDEPTRKGIGPREIAWYARWVQSLAPGVPTTMNECGPYLFDRFASTVDVFSVDPYPVYTTLDLVSAGDAKADAEPDLDMVSRWLSLARQSAPADHPFVGVVECFTFDKDARRPPTGAEVRNMVYQTVASGAAGVIYYSVREPKWRLIQEPLLKEISAINSELGEIESWLTTPPLEARDEPLAIRADRRDRLVAATWRQGTRYLTILVNLDRAPRAIRLSAADHRSVADIGLADSLELPPLGVKMLQYDLASNGIQASSSLPEPSP